MGLPCWALAVSTPASRPTHSDPAVASPTSALGQKRTLHRVRPMSALPPKADIGTQPRHVRYVPIVLQKSLNAERQFFRLKPKQARTANKGDSGLITEVTGEFSARSCDPPHPYMKNAPMAQKFYDQARKTTFATVSVRSGHRITSASCPLFPRKRTLAGDDAFRLAVPVVARLQSTETLLVEL
jgi:hypothetical protein